MKPSFYRIFDRSAVKLPALPYELSSSVQLGFLLQYHDFCWSLGRSCFLSISNCCDSFQAFRYPANNPNGTRAEWTESPSHGIPAPICQETEFSRDNHLGNGLNGYPNLFNWTIPAEAIGERCTVRMRWVLIAQLVLECSLVSQDIAGTISLP